MDAVKAMREEERMRRAISRNQSVMYMGQIITKPEELPTLTELKAGKRAGTIPKAPEMAKDVVAGRMSGYIYKVWYTLYSPLWTAGGLEPPAAEILSAPRLPEAERRLGEMAGIYNPQVLALENEIDALTAERNRIAGQDVYSMAGQRFRQDIPWMRANGVNVKGAL